MEKGIKWGLQGFRENRRDIRCRTVNLLATPSMVRIHHLPPTYERSRTLADDVKLVGEGFGYVVRIGTDTDWVAVSAASMHNLALREVTAACGRGDGMRTASLAMAHLLLQTETFPSA